MKHQQSPYSVEAGVSGCAAHSLYSDFPATQKPAVNRLPCPYQFLLSATNLKRPQWVPSPGLLASCCAIMTLTYWFSVLGVLGLRSGCVTMPEAFVPGNGNRLLMLHTHAYFNH